MVASKQNLQRDTLRKLQSSNKNQLIPLRIEYSEKSTLLTGTINKLVNINRIYPRHLPTQASFRWSTVDPPITNWPRACINQNCIEGEHEWTEQCWSIRDILLPDDNEILVSWDHDNIEGKIHDLIVNDEEAIQAHIKGYDLHTITCCNIFNYDYPISLTNPHTECECSKEWVNLPVKMRVEHKLYCVHCIWRAKYNWQGKDTKQRVLAKNFNHGSKYTKTWRFVYRIAGIEKYGVSTASLGKLAKVYIASKKDAWQCKLEVMESIRRTRIARTLYGGRRIFYNSSEDTAKEGFSHMISGTVSDYNNETLILLESILGSNIRLLHNAHDGDKIAIKKLFLSEMYPNIPIKSQIIGLREYLKPFIERPIEYQGRSLIMTAGIKVYD